MAKKDDKYRIEKLESQIKKYHSHLKQFDLLCDMIADLQNKDQIRDIYKYIASKLHSIYKHTLVLYVSINEEIEETCLEYTAGVNEALLKKIINLTGFNPIGKKYKLLPQHNNYFRSGDLVEFPGDLHEFSKGEFPRVPAQAIQKLIGLHKIYTIGILKATNLLGAVHILTFNKTTITDKKFIGIFIKQAGIIIQKKKLDCKLKKSEQRVQLILRSLPDMMFIQNSDGEYIDFYIPENIDTDIPPQVSVGEKIHKVLEENTANEFIKAFARAKNSEQMQFLEYASFVGTEKHYYEARVICYDKDKFLSIVRDITKSKIASQKITCQNEQLTELNKGKDRFISILAHDLKSSFNSMLGFSDILAQNIEVLDREKVKKHVTIINDTAQKTYSMFEDILIWAKSQTGKFEFEPKKYNAAELIKDVIPQMQTSALNKNISIAYSSCEDILISADISMFKTILRNLISNAIKFTPAGGEISIHTDSTENYCQICVTDNGIGISEDTLESLFHKEQDISTPGTENEKGTGLGLLIAKEFVDRHSGKIRAESQPGKGSTFCFSIPKAEERPT
jgi:nitrogen-specific signal transduction histidine kinase